MAIMSLINVGCIRAHNKQKEHDLKRRLIFKFSYNLCDYLQESNFPFLYHIKDCINLFKISRSIMSVYTDVSNKGYSKNIKATMNCSQNLGNCTHPFKEINLQRQIYIDNGWFDLQHQHQLFGACLFLQHFQNLDLPPQRTLLDGQIPPTPGKLSLPGF